MPRPGVQKHGGDKLPCIRIANPPVAQAQKVANDSRLIGFKKELRDERRDVCADQNEQDHALPFAPTPCQRRRLPAGQAHETRVSQRNFFVDSEIKYSRKMWWSGRDQNAEPACANLKFNRAIAD